MIFNLSDNPADPLGQIGSVEIHYRVHPVEEGAATLSDRESAFLISLQNKKAPLAE